MHSVAQFTENAVRVVGWSDSPFLILMERFDASLDDLIVQPRNAPLNLQVVASILADICRALAVCERMSIVHNDVKPRMNMKIASNLHRKRAD